MAHNPEVEGSNPSPATKMQVRGPLRTRMGPLACGLRTDLCTALAVLAVPAESRNCPVTVTCQRRQTRCALPAVLTLARLLVKLLTMTMRRLAESDAELARGQEVTAAELAQTIRNRSAHE